MKQCEERRFQVEWFEVKLEMLFPVFSEDSGVVEFVSVFLPKLDLGKASGLLDDGLVKDGIVEGGLVLGRIGVFFGQCFRVSWAVGEDCGEESVVVEVVVPVSEGKFTLAWYVVKQLSVLGGSAVVSG